MKPSPEVIKCLIVDDEKTACEIIEMHLHEVPNIKIVGSCLSATAASQVVSSEGVDLIFLDINMPDIKGTDFAASLDSNIKVIFTTAYRHYAVEGFELQATDYLLKPISKERLLKAIDKYRADTAYLSRTEANIHSLAPKFILLKSNRQVHKLALQSLMYIESFGDYLHVNCTSGQIVIRETISSFILQLDDDFIRVHRSFIVSKKHINAFSTDTVSIDNKQIPISRSYKKTVWHMLNTSDNENI